MRCSNCGAQLQEGDKFCTSCGAKTESPVQQSSQSSPPPPPPRQDNQPSRPEPRQKAQTQPNYPPPNQSFSNGNPPPVGVLKFLLVNILFAIPIINIIAILVISFKGDVNPSLRNYARALLIFIVLGIILMVATGSLQFIFDMFNGGFNPSMYS
ncbi:MAG: zinc ribbon domain-containing protein [Clostridia bacterium]